jgi:hypothetical protein
MVGMEHCEAVKFYDSCSFWVAGLSLNCDAFLDTIRILPDSQTFRGIGNFGEGEF